MKEIIQKRSYSFHVPLIRKGFKKWQYKKNINSVVLQNSSNIQIERKETI